MQARSTGPIPARRTPTRSVRPDNVQTREQHPVDEILRGPIKSKTIFPALLLHLLEEQADHGYGLMQRIDRLCGDLIAVNTNKIYPLLRRLEERGFVSATWDHPTKRSRRIYAITPAGLERLERIKSAMNPYLETIEGAIARLRKALYA
jgi:PadR family transcriptional regulator, regulatory protein PadR